MMLAFFALAAADPRLFLAPAPFRPAGQAAPPRFDGRVPALQPLPHASAEPPARGGRGPQPLPGAGLAIALTAAAAFRVRQRLQTSSVCTNE